MSRKSAGVDTGSTDDEVHMDPQSAGGIQFCTVKTTCRATPVPRTPMNGFDFRAIISRDFSPTFEPNPISNHSSKQPFSHYFSTNPYLVRITLIPTHALVSRPALGEGFERALRQPSLRARRYSCKVFLSGSFASYRTFLPHSSNH
jgi:hypothetical protein